MAIVDAYVAIDMVDPGSASWNGLDVVYADFQLISLEDPSSLYSEDYHGSFFYDLFDELDEGIIREIYYWERSSPVFEWELLIGITGLDVDVDRFLDLLDEGNGTAMNAYLFREPDTFLASNFSDRIVAYGGNDLVYGFYGDDVIKGMAGSDSLLGGPGNDVLNGGPGFDRLTGGPGSDVYVMQTQPSAASNVERIVGFVSGTDRIWLDDDIFTVLRTGRAYQLRESQFQANGTGTAIDANDRILYDTTSGELFYDRDGTGPIQPVRFAILSGDPQLEYDDFVVVL
jgi:Ca2+-binding RTX toxin-like protein